MSRLSLRLFISGDNPNHHGAVAQLQALCAEHLGGHCDLEVIDVRLQPERAEAERVLATPALIKVHPLPVQRVIGDFSSLERLLTELGIRPREEAEHGTQSLSSHERTTDCAAHI